jgi:methylmalonyl-CoA mutase N-terminal domain/subunit
MHSHFWQVTYPAGVAIDTVADAEILFDGIPLDRISTSFTINGTAAILLALYEAAAERKNVPRTSRFRRAHPARSPYAVAGRPHYRPPP